MLRGRQARLLVPLGLVVLLAYSALMELVQRYVGRLGRACDLADVVDNASGAVAGLALGLALAVVVTWLRRRPAPTESWRESGGRPPARQ